MNPLFLLAAGGTGLLLLSKKGSSGSAHIGQTTYPTPSAAQDATLAQMDAAAYALNPSTPADGTDGAGGTAPAGDGGLTATTQGVVGAVFAGSPSSGTVLDSVLASPSSSTGDFDSPEGDNTNSSPSNPFASSGVDSSPYLGYGYNPDTALAAPNFQAPQYGPAGPPAGVLGPDPWAYTGSPGGIYGANAPLGSLTPGYDETGAYDPTQDPNSPYYGGIDSSPGGSSPSSAYGTQGGSSGGYPGSFPDSQSDMGSPSGGSGSPSSPSGGSGGGPSGGGPTSSPTGSPATSPTNAAKANVSKEKKKLKKEEKSFDKAKAKFHSKEEKAHKAEEKKHKKKAKAHAKAAVKADNHEVKAAHTEKAKEAAKKAVAHNLTATAHKTTAVAHATKSKGGKVARTTRGILTHVGEMHVQSGAPVWRDIDGNPHLIVGSQVIPCT